MRRKAIAYTVKELAERGRQDLPGELLSSRHLIYSSPAALAFNSPGAEGFGVKRAALAIPGSVMLLVAPGCCGRNTTLVSRLPGYTNRFFYLNMDETDIVTGRHLKKIPQAVKDLCDSLEEKPSVVMICITCVDALLGTDMERVCRRAEELAGLPVRPSYMYALTREGRKPPMVHIRQSLYSLLEPGQKKGNVVNILGFFAHLEDDCELYDLLHQIGIRTINEISRCRDYEEFLTMNRANFNLVLNPEARPAAADMEKKLAIPSIELRRLYQIDKIRSQYKALGKVLGVKFDDEEIAQEAIHVIREFRERRGDLVLSIGECMNGDPFEMALAMVRYGIRVSEIFGTVNAENFIYIKHLAELSPDTRVMSNLEPTMIAYDPEDPDAGPAPSMTIGKDAGYYHPDLPNLSWNSDVQPFGYRGLIHLIRDMEAVLDGETPAKPAAVVPHYPEALPLTQIDVSSRKKGFRQVLTPFAPDQSGAVSVLFELGGIQVICDAGGCVGNICGFDEPRWFKTRSAIFSAGLRDMDAILGRDEKLVQKLADACGKIDCSFAAIIGTPVPSVIGTDYHALKRMTEKKVKLPVLAVDTNGMQLYDAGAEKAYLELFRTFAGKDEETPANVSSPADSERGRIGVIGVNPMDLSDTEAGTKIRAILHRQGWEQVDTYGMDCGLERIRTAGNAQMNLVTSPSGVAAARYLEKTFGTPWYWEDPLAESFIPEDMNVSGKKVLILAQQVTANSIRRILREQKKGSDKDTVIHTATWFMRLPELSEPGDLTLKEEKQWIELVRSGGYDVIFADPVLWKLVPEYAGERIDLVHFALSGSLKEREILTHRIRVYGIVQGVGFRPTVSRHGTSAEITGTVCNFGPYVEILAQGTREQLEYFEYLLVEKPPRRAAILKVDIKTVDDADTFDSFQIIESGKTSGEIFISPDIAICDDCIQEMYDPKDRRFRHAFINCTCCGPRLTILDSLPYDRVRTSMKEHPMCPSCGREYVDPATRRYDAQPVCCPDCGPQVYMLPEKNPQTDICLTREELAEMPEVDLEAVKRARRIIADGGIVAIKGIGGFHLCCDARNQEAVELLRTRKHRPAKPFAVMMKDMEAVNRYCQVTPLVEEILTGHQKPILLLEKKGPGEETESRLAESVAPDNPKLGVMLPYTPLHHLLFSLPSEDGSEEADGIRMTDCLVMTSGNISGAPICRDDVHAEKELRRLCDGILSHNRKIRIRADDTVMDLFEGEPYMIRRSRGYAPLPFLLSGEREGKVLGIGGELKNSFCIGTGSLFYPSPYVGDLGDVRTVDALKETVERFCTLLEIRPETVACDLHPRYNSTAVAEELDIPLVRVQHHYAHILSCMAENDFTEPVIGVSYDGTGYGTDGTIWGGEILEADVHGFRRAGHIAPFLQPGGDASAREGWRIAVSMILSLEADREKAQAMAESLGLCDPAAFRIQQMMHEKKLNTVTSTSAGRLFDAVSAILGIRRSSTFEGEASTQLMFAAQRYDARRIANVSAEAESPAVTLGESFLVLSTDRLVEEILRRRCDGEDVEELAWLFHQQLAAMTAAACEKIRERGGANTVALSGGVYQNTLLLRMTRDKLKNRGFRVLIHRMVPPNDGGIGLGQALYAMENPAEPKK